MKRVVAKLLLEQIGTCLAFSKLDGAIATFAFKDFPMIAPDGTFTSADLFEVKVDVEACEMTSAVLDGDSLTEREVLTLVWFNVISAAHTRLHAVANWGVNVNAPDAFVRQNGVVTTMYNYYGFSLFRELITAFKAVGAVKHETQPGLQDVFSHGAASGVLPHSQIHELVPHSRTVRFVVKTRGAFLALFAKHALCGNHLVS